VGVDSIISIRSFYSK